MADLFVQNLDVVYFFYGFAYTALGIVIFAQVRAVETSQFKLINSLWLLGSFGLIHAAGEFTDMFIIIKGTAPFLEIAGPAAVIASYLFLFSFGYRLINIGDRKRVDIWLPVLLAALFFSLPLYLSPTSLRVWAISACYFFGFPGAVLSAAGFLFYSEFKSGITKPGSIRSYLILAAGFFAVYGVMGGLVVAKAGFFPASVVNNTSFLALFGFPPQLVRAVAATVIAWSIWMIADIFNLEQTAHRRRAQEQLRQAYDGLEQRVAQRTAELAETEQKFRGLVETTVDWVWEVDENVVYTYASPQIRAILGYEPDEVLGKTPFDLMPEDEARRVAEAFKPIAEARQPFMLLENTNLHKDGRRVVLETSGTPIFDAEGRFRGYRGIDRGHHRAQASQGAQRRFKCH